MKKTKSIILLTVVLALFVLSFSVFASDNQEEGFSCQKDSFFPDQGNCGYEAAHYNLDLAWDEPTDILTGYVGIVVNSLWDTSEITFDFSSTYTVSSVKVDGMPVDFKSENDNLVVSGNFKQNKSYQIEINYSGHPQNGNFLMTDEQRAALAGKPFCNLAEPNAASNIFPCNNTTKDKASFSIKLTVPSKYIPASNGTLVEIIQADGTSLIPDDKTLADYKPTGDKVTWRYEEKEAMAPYLFVFCMDEFKASLHTEEDGLLETNFISKNIEDQKAAEQVIGLQEDIKKCFESATGTAYPFSAYGATLYGNVLGGALETQSRPVYDPSESAEFVFAHEIAHQWIGDQVSIADWSDLWIKEGWASYGQALWERCAGRPEGYTKTMEDFYTSLVNNGLSKYSATDLVNGMSGSMADQMKAASLTADQVVEGVNLLCGKGLDQTKLKADAESALVDGKADGMTLLNLVPKYCETIIYSTKKGNDFKRLLGMEVSDSNEEPKIHGPKQIGNTRPEMYNNGPYAGGAMVYYVLNQKLGDEKFTEAMQLVLKRYGGKTITTEEIISCFSEIAGEDLTDFIHPWLYYEPHVPDMPNGPTYAEARYPED